MSAGQANRTHALLLMMSGYSVIPVSLSDKKPVGEWKPFQSRIPREDEVVMMFARHRNVGLVTGEVSGVVVIDADTPEAIAWLQAHAPQTARVQTPRGEHWYYRHPGLETRNSACHGLDLRGDGGYVICPPSSYGPNLYKPLNGTRGDFWPFRQHSLPEYDPALYARWREEHR